jgi:CBS domain-containing protein
MSAIDCGEIPSSPSPVTSGLDVLSICISSTWFRVIGGLGNISAIQANACQAANGTGIKMGLMPADPRQGRMLSFPPIPGHLGCRLDEACILTGSFDLACRATPAAAGAKESGMIVKTVLAAKGGKVVSIEPTADLVAAAKLLTTHRIGVLVVMDAGGHLVGILSERDIMRALAESAGAALQLSVAQVMTRNVSTCGVNDSISSILKRMTTGKFRHMPVLDNHLLVGLISIGDIGKQQMERLLDHARQLDEYIDHINLMKL